MLRQLVSVHSAMTVFNRTLCDNIFLYLSFGTDVMIIIERFEINFRSIRVRVIGFRLHRLLYNVFKRLQFNVRKGHTVP